MAMLEIKGLCKSFGEVHAVDHVDLTVEDGEMLCLLGPSGCGKTTLLRLLSGFLEADEGSILMAGTDVTHLPPERRPTSLVFQNYALFPHLTVYENIAFGLKLQKRPVSEIKKRVEHAMDIVDLVGKGGRAITQLSGGQQQRVALARALIMEPKVLLLDEPLSNLDAKLRVETRQQIRRLQQNVGITAVFVTHDQEEAMTMGDQVVILESGKLQQKGSPIELYRKPRNLFVAGFLGTPSMNFLDVSCVGGNCTLNDKVLPVKGTVPDDGGYVLGIRPEDICLGENGQMEPVSALVVQVELLGADALVYLAYNGKVISCRVPSTAVPEQGQEIGVTFQIEKALLFHRESGICV